mmetsp:Transcript_4136/g.8970  ORF Transcript_4136/g.8970 Transcript_4136/m.8970 type:complete len:203 (-) Transcript_4136:529-1137(-)|eukprot:CAMPEP_0174727592 /NCGR_PEP_ID=MMETSP1094-20130205/50099_1 /TAXON_ID=156173 /ORGANISM="Chrysochromulina brevifilum, Strain UTEX LB 985" /LENGTH=202 /DNA_ID=CAMNT_0015929367 /DNA_START=514 /DNA_END=1122 /DNA_ORIENTATION=+
MSHGRCQNPLVLLNGNLAQRPHLHYPILRPAHEQWTAERDARDAAAVPLHFPLNHAFPEGKGTHNCVLTCGDHHVVLHLQRTHNIRMPPNKTARSRNLSAMPNLPYTDRFIMAGRYHPVWANVNAKHKVRVLCQCSLGRAAGLVQLPLGGIVRASAHELNILHKLVHQPQLDHLVATTAGEIFAFNRKAKHAAAVRIVQLVD